MTNERFLFTECHYIIDGFFPPDPKESNMSAWGFSIKLSPEATKFCTDKIINDKIKERINEHCNTIRDRYFKPRAFPKDTLMFCDNNSLVHSCSVPGNACGLDLHEIDYNGQAIWLPHNVDSSAQSVCLLSVWLHWWNLISVYVVP